MAQELAAAPKPVWPEVEPILNPDGMVPRRELSIRGKPGLKAASGPVDPALWNCVCLFELRLELADGALTTLPPQVSRRPRTWCTPTTPCTFPSAHC